MSNYDNDENESSDQPQVYSLPGDLKIGHLDVLKGSDTGRTLLDLFKRWRIQYDYGSDGFSAMLSEGREEEISTTILMSRLAVATGAPAARFEPYLDLWIEEQRKRYVARILTNLRAGDHCALSLPESDGAAWNELRKWVDAVCVDGSELSTVVMAHWIWCVRRRLAGLPVTDPLCPVLLGLTRGGKTTAASKLIAPIKGLTRSLDLNQVTDNRLWSIYGTTYVAFVDELAKADRACLDSLKMLVTAEQVFYRPMGTNRLARVPMNCSFLGTSNKSIASTIRDDTSGARFWEIRCRDVLDWSIINNIDYDLLWSCIAPGDPTPLQGAVRDKILKLQHAKLRMVNPIEVWLTEIGYAPCAREDGCALSRLQASVYDDYCVWADRARIKPVVSRIQFGYALKNLRYENHRTAKGMLLYYLQSDGTELVKAAPNGLAVSDWLPSM
jgi:hypothetical protein